jgi:peroxin-6
VLQLHRSTNQAVVLPPSRPPPVTNGGLGDDNEADDISNNTLYSAAEDRFESRTTSSPDEYATGNLDSEFSCTDGGDLSDQEDIISLSALTLPPESSGVLYSFTSVITRPFKYRANGIATPGSVHSSCMATTTQGLQGLGPSAEYTR